MGPSLGSSAAYLFTFELPGSCRIYITIKLKTYMLFFQGSLNSLALEQHTKTNTLDMETLIRTLESFLSRCWLPPSWDERMLLWLPSGFRHFGDWSCADFPGGVQAVGWSTA